MNGARATNCQGEADARSAHGTDEASRRSLLSKGELGSASKGHAAAERSGFLRGVLQVGGDVEVSGHEP
ncbi:MAG: hypothetical protein ACJAR2_001979 [Ilumatobacter sp.]|jgi:hypothetical protein